MKKHLRLPFLALVALLALCGGCLAVNPADKEVAIGVILPLSGVHEPSGKGILEGLQLAVSELNRDSGIDGRTVRLLVADDTGLPEKTKEIMNRMILTDKVSAVAGGYASSCALAMREIAEEKEIPCVVISASSTEITENVRYTFRVGFSDATQARALAKFARERGYYRMAVLLDLDKDATYSRDLGRRTAQEFYDLMGDMPLRCGFHKTEESRLAALKKAMTCNTQVIVLPLYFKETAKCIRILRSLGYAGLILAGDGADGDYAKEGVATGDFVYSLPFSLEADFAPAKKFIAHYRNLKQHAPTAAVAMGYEAGKLLPNAFRGTENPAKAAKNLREMHSYPSVIAPVKREADGKMRHSVFLIGVRPFGNKMIQMYDASSLADPPVIK